MEPVPKERNGASRSFSLASELSLHFCSEIKRFESFRLHF